MTEYNIICNCGNKIAYSSETTEEKTIICSVCGKKIKVLNYANKLEVQFL